MDFSSHFDAAAFEMLRDVMDDDFSDLLAVYIQDSDDRMPRMQSALSSQNPAALGELAHSFKGASSNIGAFLLADLCLTLETATQSDQLKDLDKIVTDIEQEYQQVKALLQFHI